MFPLYDSIKSPRFPYVNFLLIVFTAYIFYLQITASNPEAFITSYALIPSQVNFQVPSTLFPFISAIFLHGGFLHIITNMWFLWVFGDNVETHVGALVYPFIYIISGIVGNVLQYMLMPTSPIPMLGASGAVAGVLGAYYALFPHAKITTFIPFFGFLTLISIPATLMLGYWFVLQIISGIFSLPGSSETGGIAFFAHAGGFVAGLIMGKILKKTEALEGEIYE